MEITYGKKLHQSIFFKRNKLSNEMIFILYIYDIIVFECIYYMISLNISIIHNTFFIIIKLNPIKYNKRQINFFSITNNIIGIGNVFLNLKYQVSAFLSMFNLQ